MVASCRRFPEEHTTEWNAAGYAEIAKLQEVMAEQQLALLDLAGAERILDVGCGNGKDHGADRRAPPTWTRRLPESERPAFTEMFSIAINA